MLGGERAAKSAGLIVAAVVLFAAGCESRAEVAKPPTAVGHSAEAQPLAVKDDGISGNAAGAAAGQPADERDDAAANAEGSLADADKAPLAYAAPVLSDDKRSVSFPLGERIYTVPLESAEFYRYAHAVMTPLGVVWNAPPAMAWPVGESGAMRPYPTSATALYLSPKDADTLKPETSKKLLEIPAKADGVDGFGDPTYHYLSRLLSTGHWLVYSTYRSEPAINQPFSNTLSALDIRSGRQTNITDYHDAGGSFFSIALYSHDVFYAKMTLDADGSGLYATFVYDLQTGEGKQLSTGSELEPISYTVDGKEVRIQWSDF